MALQPIELMGAPASPYTRKMLALMRFRHIPYRVRWQSFSNAGQDDTYPKPKVGLLPTFYFPDADGALEAVTDSSPILRRFEETHQGRSVLPPDPILSLLNNLLEDYGDEWLTKAMFHYRWHYKADTTKAGTILPRYHALTADDETLKGLSAFITEKQVGRLSYVGSNEITKQTIEESFKRFLALFDAHIRQDGFLFGARPASADYAIYGQLTQLALFDPTSQAIVLANAPRVAAWTEVMEDLSGLPVADSDWRSADDMADTLHALLGEIGSLYLPYLHANASAVMKGDALMQTELDGRAWSQNPFPYQAKCLHWLSQDYAALSAKDKQRLADLTDGTSIVEQLSAQTPKKTK